MARKRKSKRDPLQAGLAALREGQHDRAHRLLSRALQAHPDDAQALANRALARRALGDLSGAAQDLQRAVQVEPGVVRVWQVLAQVLSVLGRVDQAVDAARAAVRLQPDDPAGLDILATTLHATGQAQEAQRTFQRVLALDPRHASAHLHLGLMAQEQGAHRLAASHLGAAVGLAPEVVPAWLSLARSLRELGRYDKAVEVLVQARQHHPQAADLHAEEGQVWLRAGQPQQARASLEAALDLDPQHLYAAQALGTLLSSQGELQACLRAHVLAISSPEAPTWAWIGFADAVAALPQVPAGLSAQLLAALRQDGVDHQRLERAIRAELERLPGIPEALDGGAIPPALLEHPLLQPWLTRTIVCHPGWERLLTRLRDQLLAEAPDSPVLYALATQDWHTESAWARPRADWPPPLVREPDPIDEIEVLALTSDAVSLAVREQYEANPYPRLVSLHRKPAEPLAFLLKGLFPHFDRVPEPDQLDILVAGCGTGQQALAAATRYHGARVLAVDLSRASCAATLGNARRWGLDNLRVAQADILALDALDQRFHLVEAGGVLHHLADPMAGWRVLTHRTLPGGLMKIGLYSEQGREGVMAARALLEQAGARTDPEGLRAARQLILDLPQGHLAREVLWSPDFYSLSGFRDLVLHVCEHRFTLEGIGEALDALGLELVGFQHGRPEPGRWYARRWPEDTAQIDLSRWARVEAEHHRAFAGMYQFWCAKPATG